MTRICGIEVQKDEDGYFWQQGPDCGGYYDTEEECIACIRRTLQADADAEAEMYGTRYDSPSLDPIPAP